MLTQRLSAAAELIGVCDTLYDVGCDHGYLPLALLKAGKAARACFCDVSPAALEKARLHVAQAGLSERARFVLGDGLQGLCPGPGDAVSICGMGGDTALHILAAAGALPCPAVVQANSQRETLRLGLARMGYRAKEERMVFENGRYYVVARYERGWEALDRLQACFGPRLLEARPPVFSDYLAHRRRVLEKAYRGAKDDPEDGERLLRALEQVTEAMRCTQR